MSDTKTSSLSGKPVKNVLILLLMHSSPSTHAPIKGYAIWLMPSANEKLHYQHLINRLSKLYNETICQNDEDDGRTRGSASPSFEPHITLFAFIPLDTPIGEISNTLRQVVARVTGSGLSSLGGGGHFALGLLPAQSGRSYFQSVLAPVQPTAELLSLYDQTVAAFSPASPSSSPDEKKKKKDGYFPHLSLFYGDCSLAKRDEIAAIANGEDPCLGSGQATVTIDELGIVKCAGEVEEWQLVESIVL